MAKDYTYSSVPDTIPGFITVTAIGGDIARTRYQISIAVKAIATVNKGYVGEIEATTIILLDSANTTYMAAQEYPRVMALIHQAQHPAS